MNFVLFSDSEKIVDNCACSEVAHSLLQLADPFDNDPEHLRSFDNDPVLFQFLFGVVRSVFLEFHSDEILQFVSGLTFTHSE